jgi:hypothetical protein
MTPVVSQAVEELKATFPDSSVTIRDLGDGGAQVKIDPVDPGEQYSHRETWMKFTIGFQYPYADVYPLFVRPDLTRVDGTSHGTGISLASFDQEPALQLSRKSSKLNPATDTAAVKASKVLAWLRSL